MRHYNPGGPKRVLYCPNDSVNGDPLVRTGPIWISHHGENLKLRATDGCNRYGISRPILVNPGPESPLAVPGEWPYHE